VAPGDREQRLGLAPGDLEVEEVQEVHVRAGVDDAQPAVDGERVDVELGAPALGGHDLEGVAGVDVLDDARDHRLEAPRAACWREARARPRRGRRHRRHRPGQQAPALAIVARASS
jgi:hypothetical protein